MKYKVAIKKNATGEVRIREMGSLEWNDSSYFWWTDGNFGCDCNRQWEFERAGGESITPEPLCGNTTFSVLYAELEDGTTELIDNVVTETPTQRQLPEDLPSKSK